MYLSCYTKGEIYNSEHRSVEKLEKQIQEVITNIQIYFLQNSLNCIPGRFKELVNKLGACFII